MKNLIVVLEPSTYKELLEGGGSGERVETWEKGEYWKAGRNCDAGDSSLQGFKFSGRNCTERTFSLQGVCCVISDEA